MIARSWRAIGNNRKECGGTGETGSPLTLSAFYVSYNFEQDSTTSSTQTAMELCILYEVGGVAGYHIE